MFTKLFQIKLFPVCGLLMAAFALAPGSVLAQTSPATEFSTPPELATPVQVGHVFIVMEENHSYEEVIGNPAMPYLNGLASTYALGEGYFANTHPSIGNYFMLTTGQIITNDDGYQGTVSVDNVVRELVAAGKSWKEYSEGLPYPGYDGGDTGNYTQHHNPCSYFSDVRNDNKQKLNLVPFTQFPIDLGLHALPQYSFIVPDNAHNAHDGTLAQADAWLQANIDPLLRSSDFNTPGGGMLIIVFDESDASDGDRGGGHVAWVVVGPNVKMGYPPKKSDFPVRVYQHPSTLRFMLQLLGVGVFPGASNTAPNMTEFVSGD